MVRRRRDVFPACTQDVVLYRASRSHKNSQARCVRANRDCMYLEAVLVGIYSVFFSFCFVGIVIVYTCV